MKTIWNTDKFVHVSTEKGAEIDINTPITYCTFYKFTPDKIRKQLINKKCKMKWKWKYYVCFLHSFFPANAYSATIWFSLPIFDSSGDCMPLKISFLVENMIMIGKSYLRMRNIHLFFRNTLFSYQAMSEFVSCQGAVHCTALKILVENGEKNVM